MKHRIPAIYILLTGLILGALGYLFFYQEYPGLSVPLFVSCVVLAILVWSIRNGTHLTRRKLWLLLPIAFFAAMFAVRADSTLLQLNAAVMMGLLWLFIHYLTRDEPLDEASSLEQYVAITDAAIRTPFQAVSEVSSLWKWLCERPWGDMSGLASMARGFLLALPIVIVFAILLSSADLIFAEQLRRLGRLVTSGAWESIATTLAIVAFIGWYSAGLLSYALTSRARPAPPPSNTPQDTLADAPLTKQKPRFLQLDMTEASIVLGSVVALFALFVLIQFTYLFGGRDVIEEGLTFAQYARRGFFELVAISILTLAMIRILDRRTLRRSVQQDTLFRGLCIMLVALTLVLLASAWQRMYLYEEAYGFSQLRVYTHIFMIWLALLLGVGVLELFRLKKNLFAFGLLLAGIGYFVTLNLMNVEQYIAARNIERYRQGYELDMCYLREFSVDAFPAMFDLYTTTTDEQLRVEVAHWLDKHLAEERQRHSDFVPFIETNLAHDAAWSALLAMQLEIETPTWPCWFVNPDAQHD